MSNQFNIDHQLALRIVTGDFNAQQSAVAELRAMLAAPVVERQDESFEDWADRELGLPKHRIASGDYQSFGMACAEKAWKASPPAPVASVLPERDWAKEMMEIATAPDYFPFPMDGCQDEWFKWNWSENKCRPINKYYLCDVLLSDGTLLFNQSPYDFDWSGDQVFAARQTVPRDSLEKVKEMNR